MFRFQTESHVTGATSSSEWETTSTTSADVSGTTPSVTDTAEGYDDEDEDDGGDVVSSPGEEEYDGDTNHKVVRSRPVSAIVGTGRRYVGRKTMTMSNG